MPATVIQINKAEVRFGDCNTAGAGGTLDPSALTDFSCQVTRAEITSNSNTTTTSVPATFCQPASEASVPVASSFALNLDFLQDWAKAAGLSAWLFQNDATEKCFAMYIDGAKDPVATGKIIAQAGGFGGTPGEPLTSSVTLNIQGYPNITDPTGTPLRDPLDVSNSSADFVTAAAFADLATLKADGSSGDGSFGGTFTSGQYIVLGDKSKAHYATNAWTVGAMP